MKLVMVEMKSVMVEMKLVMVEMKSYMVEMKSDMVEMKFSSFRPQGRNEEVSFRLVRDMGELAHF